MLVNVYVNYAHTINGAVGAFSVEEVASVSMPRNALDVGFAKERAFVNMASGVMIV